MITPFIFLKLLNDPDKQQSCFDSFIRKYKTKFDNSISIRFSAKKYEGVDVSAFFYHNFKEFVIKDLSVVNQDVSFDNWVYEMSERRIKSIYSDVNKEVARILTQIGGASNWGIACEIIYTEYHNILNEVVFSNFRDDKYKGLKRDIADILFQRFYLSRINPAPIASIENYEGWLRTCLRNLANRDRDIIEEEVIIRDGDNISLNQNISNHARTGCDPTSDTVDEFTESQSQMPITSVSEDETELEGDDDKVPFVDDSNDSTSSDTARALLESYFNLMTNPMYVELIRAIILEGVPVETMAEEWKCTNAAIYNMKNEAMTALVRVALPEIRKRNIKKYKKIQSYLKLNPDDQRFSDYELMILKKFFEDHKSVEDIAKEYHREPYTMAANIRKALKALYKFAQSLDPEEPLSKDEEIVFKKSNDFLY